MRQAFLYATALSVITWAMANTGVCQEPRQRPDVNVVSPEVSADRKITFRIHAPKASAIRLASSDLPGLGRGAEMAKGEGDVWETTVGPVGAGAYRYHFNVDGLAVIDPRNPTTSEANSNTWSLVYVPGSDVSDVKAVPHGSIAQVPYYSTSLKRFRRMHVYLPPGYENGEGKFPVLYLLHGATDSDASWSTVGRAGFILDNLIASGKAKPMIVVMPAGHVGPFRFGGPPNDFEKQMDAFGQDFANDVRPHVEKNYRVLGDRANRAIAGLSMGGAQTLNVGMANLKDYGYLGVFSSGVFGIAGGFGGAGPNTQWEDSHRKQLDDAEAKKGLRLTWFATGKDDFLVQTSRATVAMLKNHGFDVVYRETDGGHTWINWRAYLAEFASKLFMD